MTIFAHSQFLGNRSRA